MNSATDKIHARLSHLLSPIECEVIDEGHLHVGHAGAKSGGGHFAVKIVSPAFKGVSLVSRHQMIYDALKEMMQEDIHALRIEASAPDENQSQ